jgi:hypothetical protein
MTMNYEGYTYTELDGYKNVYRREYKAQGNPYQGPAVLAPKLAPLVDAILAQRPKWKFVARQRTGTVLQDDGTSAHAFGALQVYTENDEILGELDTTYTYRGGESQLTYTYDNERLSAKRMRGSWSKSTKLDKAVKDVLKNFRPKDTTEIVRDRMALVGSVVGQTVAEAHNKFIGPYTKLNQQMTNFVMSNWSMLSPMFTEAGIEFDSQMPEIYAAAIKAKEMGESFRPNGGGVTIIVRPSDYLVVRNTDTDGKTDVQIKTPEELPAEVRRKLGILKLTELRQYVPDMGVHCAKNTYFITGKDMM